MKRDLVEDIYPLSPAQQGMLFHTLAAPGSGQYLAQVACLLGGDLAAAAFRAAWEKVVERHTALRTIFLWERRDEPLQVVYRQVRLPWREEDWRGLPADRQERRFADLLRRDLAEDFDLARPPLMRFALLRVAERGHRFLWTSHHLLLDGWSLPLVLAEVFRCYGALRRGEAPALAASPPYGAFIAWLRRQDRQEAEASWRRTLAGFGSPTPICGSGAGRRGERGHGECKVELGEEVTERLRDLARRRRLTLGTLVAGAWAALLARYSGEPDVVFGLTVSGRPAALPGVESTVGVFIATLPLRVQVAAAPLVEWLRQLQERQADLQRYAYAPLADVQRWSDVPSGTPLFDSILVFENYPAAAGPERGQDGIEIGDVRTTERTSYPITVAAVIQARFHLSLAFDRQRLEPLAARRMLGHLASLLAGMVEVEHGRVSELPLLSAAERQLLREWNPGRGSWPRLAAVHELFAAQARRAPGAVAVVDGRERVTYGELDRRADRLADRLLRLGIGPEARVGVLLERSALAVAAILAVLKAGAAYVPLDPAQGPGRLARLVEDARLAALLCAQPPALPVEPQRVIVLGTSWEVVDERQESPAPRDPAALDNLAYVIFTSGSTGRPKGVMVSHRSLCTAYLAWQAAYGLRAGAAHLQMASLSFDVFTEELVRALCSGGRLVLCPRDLLFSPDELVGLLRRERIDVLELVPAVMRPLVDHLEAAGEDFAGLELLVLGTEAWYGSELDRLARLCGAGTRLVNSYGVTEATIDSTCFEGGARLAADAMVPIGRPLANSRLHIVDNELRLLPVGIAGELLVGGEGLARGYLNRPDQTAERFVPDPFGTARGGRLYRTGDLARYLPDGNVQLLGRADDQVKIRGVRVEPGEVEAVLSQHPAVARCAVAARRRAAPEAFLAAWVVPAEGRSCDPGELRRFLAAELPAAMVPAAFVVLPELPLTPHGKVDRRALPEPGPAGGGGRSPVAARTPIEAELARVWETILRIERIGVEENFFDLGGDSILSIQIVAAARRSGLRLTARQLFDHPTIAQLASVAGLAQPEGGGAPEQAVGPVPLTPIQSWFFEQGFADPHHWNQAVLLESAQPLDPAHLERALAAVEALHPALRLRFRQGKDGWSQSVGAADRPIPATAIDLSALPEPRRGGALAAAAGELQGSLDLAGPLARLALLRWGPGAPDRLLVIVHHLAIDGVSWAILLGDLEAAYAQLAAGRVLELQPATTSFPVWAERLREVAGSPDLAREVDSWLAALAGAERLAPLPVDHPSGAMAGKIPTATTRVVSMSLDAETTRFLLRDAHRVYHTRGEELLLTALALTFRRWSGQPSLLVDLESHGRPEDLPAGVDLSRTIGWFTAVHPVLLELSAAADPAAAVAAVKSRLRAVPRRGIGFGLLRYASGSGESARRLAALPRPEVSFNYLGQIDRVLAAASPFRPAQESCGPMVSPRGHRGYLLEVNALVAGGRLRCDWSYSSALHRQATIEALAGELLGALRSLAAAGAASSAVTSPLPGDFPLARIERAALARIAGGGAPIEDLYPLSALQQEMLFHSLSAPGSGLYVEQLSCVLEGPLDLACLREAWRRVVARHAVLRGECVWEGVEEPLFVIRRGVQPAWQELDWRGRSAGVQRASLARLRAGERRLGFDLSRAPLMRLTAVRTGDASWRLVWCLHHLLLDGWSVPIVLADLLALYDGLRSGRPPLLADPPPFRDHIAWLRRQELQPARRFFRQLLAGFTAPHRLAGDRAAAAAPTLSGERRLLLPAAPAAALQGFARRHRLTLNTLLQGAWAILLGRYTGAEDVVYGSAFAGRPAALPDSGSMVGLFINTLPVRVEARGSAPLLPWLQGLQDRLLELASYEHMPLAEIQGASAVPGGRSLFESLIVVENFPARETLPSRSGEVLVRDVTSTAPRFAPLTVAAAPGAGLLLAIGYDAGRFDPPTVLRMLEHFRNLACGMATGRAGPLADLPLLGEAERFALVVEWNATAAPPPPAGLGLCIHALLAALPDLATRMVVRLLDRGLELVPIGVPGELCVGGPGVGRGSLGRPDLTAERFIPDPCGGSPGDRLYRTGDLARHLADGRLELLGRVDGGSRSGGSAQDGELFDDLVGGLLNAEGLGASRPEWKPKCP
jgi:amino acid adenylation domain-containing protein/non-ribosomal peptide synthase protein (TIGR01720 family)